MTKVAINGMGRIGRAAFKIVMDRPELELVAVNDLMDQVIQVHEVVDRHQFQLGPVHDDFESRPANPSHAVNRYLGHNHPPPQNS